MRRGASRWLQDGPLTMASSSAPSSAAGSASSKGPGSGAWRAPVWATAWAHQRGAATARTTWAWASGEGAVSTTGRGTMAAAGLTGAGVGSHVKVGVGVGRKVHRLWFRHGCGVGEFGSTPGPPSGSSYVGGYDGATVPVSGGSGVGPAGVAASSSSAVRWGGFVGMYGLPSSRSSSAVGAGEPAGGPGRGGVRLASGRPRGPPLPPARGAAVGVGEIGGRSGPGGGRSGPSPAGLGGNGAGAGGTAEGC